MINKPQNVYVNRRIKKTNYTRKKFLFSRKLYVLPQHSQITIVRAFKICRTSHMTKNQKNIPAPELEQLCSGNCEYLLSVHLRTITESFESINIMILALGLFEALVTWLARKISNLRTIVAKTFSKNKIAFKFQLLIKLDHKERDLVYVHIFDQFLDWIIGQLNQSTAMSKPMKGSTKKMTL